MKTQFIVKKHSKKALKKRVLFCCGWLKR